MFLPGQEKVGGVIDGLLEALALAEGYRRHPERLAEDEMKIVVRGEAALEGDLLDGQCGVAQEMNRFLQPEAEEKMLGRYPGLAAEELSHLGGRQIDATRQ